MLDCSSSLKRTKRLLTTPTMQASSLLSHFGAKPHYQRLQEQVLDQLLRMLYAYVCTSLPIPPCAGLREAPASTPQEQVCMQKLGSHYSPLQIFLSKKSYLRLYFIAKVLRSTQEIQRAGIKPHRLVRPNRALHLCSITVLWTREEPIFLCRLHHSHDFGIGCFNSVSRP